MEPRRISIGAMVVALGLTFLVTSAAFGCLMDDQAKCQFRERVNLTVVGGGNGKGNASLIRPSHEQALKTTLAEYVYGKTSSTWNQAGDVPATAVSKVTHPITAASGIRKMTDAELVRALDEAYAQSMEGAASQARRIAVIKTEQKQRVQAKARAAAAKQKLFVPVPKPSDAVHVPEPAVPGSADPYNAPAPQGAWVYIGPQSTVWYNVGDRGRRLNLALNDNQQAGMVMAVYGPDQTDVWESKPTGQGTPEMGFDSFWTGRARAHGIWRVRITNLNDFSVQYSLTATNVADKGGDLCRDCHGNIEDEWDRCDHDGSFCNDLIDDYRN
jgi:hypothetical protein